MRYWKSLLAGVVLCAQSLSAFADYETLPGKPGNFSTITDIKISPDRTGMTFKVYCFDSESKSVNLVASWSHRIDVWAIEHIWSRTPDYVGEIPLGGVHRTFAEGEVRSWNTPNMTNRPFPMGTTLIVRFPGDTICPAGFGNIDT